MMKSKYVFAALVLALSLGQPAHIRAQNPSGEELLNQLLAATKSGDSSRQAKLYARAYQSAHEDGGRDRAQELELLKNVDITDYTLSDVKITEQGPVVVVTYFAELAETIEGTRLPKRKAARLTVFLKTDDGWKAIAHANLNPLSK